MKKLILIVVLIVSSIGCRDPFHGGGIITDKGVDYIHIKVMFESFDIKYCDKDKNVVEMYWIKLNSCDDKIYVNLFTWEDNNVNDFIIIKSKHSDLRFTTEY